MFTNTADYVRSRDHRLETAGAAAPAFQSAGIDFEMAEFTAEPERPPLQLPPKDQAASDAGPQRNIENVVEAFSRACPPLAIGPGIGVILKDNRDRDLPRQLREDING